MAIATFATKSFQVNSNKIYSFDEFQYSSSLQTDKQDATGSKPSTYNKGPDLDKLSFKIHLDVSQGIKPRQEWEDWKTIASKGTAYPFILGGKPLGSNKWLLTNIDASNAVIDNAGHILSLDLALSFDEYARSGTPASTNKPKNETVSLSDSEMGSLIE